MGNLCFWMWSRIKCLFNPLEIILKPELVFYHSFYLAQQDLFLLSGLIHLHNVNAINIKHALSVNLDLGMVQEMFFCESEAISWRSTTSVSPSVSPSPGRPTCGGPSGTSPSSLLPSLESHLRHSSLDRRGEPFPPPPTSTSTPSPPSHPNTPPLSERGYIEDFLSEPFVERLVIGWQEAVDRCAY